MSEDGTPQLKGWFQHPGTFPALLESLSMETQAFGFTTFEIPGYYSACSALPLYDFGSVGKTNPIPTIGAMTLCNNVRKEV